jgi:pimeloyl-ACP methyl ester carboxylesterase
MTAIPAIHRTFVDVLGTSLHIRWCGRGVPVLLIHQSPVSARIQEDRLRAWGDGYLCIAPDIPGMGQSGAIAEPVPTIAHLAKYFLGVLDRLGIGRALVWGAHTGALIGTHMALRHPDRVAGLILDGYPIYTDEEVAQRLATYFPPLELRWDGAHLLWLWHRYREQFLYWPWNAKTPRTRATAAIPDPAFLHAGVAEMARTHHTYPQCYAAAFSYDAAGALAALAVPTHFMAGEADSLTRKLSLLAPKPGLHHLHKITGGRAAQIAAERRLLDDMAAGDTRLPSMPALPAPDPPPSRWYASSPQGHQVALRRLPGAGPPVLVLPPIPAGADLIQSMPGARDSGRALVLVDPPGIGGVPPGPAARMQGCVAAIAGALQGRHDILAFGYAAALIPSLRAALGDAAGRVIAVDGPVAPDAPLPFDATLCAAGGHLLRFWDRWRFERLFSPAATRTVAAIRHGAAEDLATLADFTLNALEALPHWPEMEADLLPSLSGRWLAALRPGDALLFTQIDATTRAALQAAPPPADVVDLSETGQSAFDWLREASP